MAWLVSIHVSQSKDNTVIIC